MRTVNCCVRGCNVTFQSVPQRTFSIVPRLDETRRSIWLKKVGREDLLNVKNTSKFYVCSDHFSENQFSSTLKSRLRKLAVPDVILPDAGNNERNFTSSSVGENNLKSPTNEEIQGSLVSELAILLVGEDNDDEFSSNPDQLTNFEIPLNYDRCHSTELVSSVVTPISIEEFIESCYTNSAVCNSPDRHPDAPNCRICYNHFPEEMIRKYGSTRILNHDAVPCINLPSQEEIKLTSSVDILPSGREMVIDVEDSSGNSEELQGITIASYRDCDESGEESEETPFEEYNVVEKVKASLCRVCGSPGDCLIPILEEARMTSLQDVPLVKVLEMYLPLQISVDDSFPLNVCSKCHDTLNEWHQFYVTCAAANETFKHLFGGGKEKEASCSALNINSTNEDTVVLPPRNDHTYVKDEQKETEKMQEDVEKKDNIGADDSDGLPMEDGEEIQPPVKLYFCKYCRESHNNTVKLKFHSRMCKEEPTLCDKCGKIIRHRKLMSAHMYKHQYIVRICDKCGESVLSKHFSTHCNSFHSGSYYCNLCCTILCSKTLYYGHMRRHRKGMIKSSFKIDPYRNDEGVDVYRCPVCEKLFKDLPSLIMHLNEPKVLRCSTCGFKYSNEKRYAIHNCRKWECQFCQKTFYIRERLMEHVRIHTGEKPFKCHFCSASFRKKYQRFVHQKTHGAPSHECKYCSKKFKLATSLRNHINAHEGVFFSCTYCDKKFPGQRYLQKHMRTHDY